MNEFIPHKQEESNLYAFYQLAKELFSNNNYKHISTDAKLLYGILRDRNELSRKNNWVDHNGHIYIIFTREEVGELLGFGKDKVIKLFKELNDVKLIKEIRQGLNKPNIIYVGKIVFESIDNSRKSEKPTSVNLKKRVQNIEKSDPSNTDIIYTEMSNTTTTRLEGKGNKVDKAIMQEYKNKIDNILDENIVADTVSKLIKEHGEKGSNHVIVSDDAIINIDNYSKSLDEPQKPKANKIDKAIVQEYKNKIDNVVDGDILTDTLSKLIKEHGTDTLDIYLKNWDKFTPDKNSIGLFIGAIKNKYSIPKAPKVAKVNNNRFMDIPQMYNFDQREYTAEDFEKFYYKIPE